MKVEMLEWLACPACGGAPLDLGVTRTCATTVYRAHLSAAERDKHGQDPATRTEKEVLDGLLSCPGCGKEYPISNGIPRMLLDPAQSPPASAQEWTTFAEAKQEWQTSFLDFIEPLQAEDFVGKLTLDAGCGYGRHAHFAARYGAEVVAMDLAADAVDATRRNTENLYRVNVVQGDIHHPPFREGLFDLVYCLGVLHHLEHPARAFQRCSSMLKTGARLSVWVYGPRKGLAVAVAGGLRAVAPHLTPEQLHLLSKGISVGLRVFSHTPYRLLQGLPGGHHLVSHLPVHDHHRWPFDVVVADVYDRLRIPVTLTLTGEDLERWYEEEGFANILVTRRVRNNESFRGTGVKR